MNTLEQPLPSAASTPPRPTPIIAEMLIDLEALTGAAYELRPLPASAARLAQLLSSESTELSEIAEVIQFDQALAAKVLRAANSALHAGLVEITNISDALFRLGSAQVLSFAIASHAKPLLQQRVSAYGLTEQQLWRHSMAAAIAAEMAPTVCQAPVPPESFAAALLHDIGKLLMGRFLDRDVLEMLERAQTQGGVAPFEAERQILQAHHGEIGGIVAQHWKLPERIVKGIIHHHTPEEGDDPVCDVVCLANTAAKAVEALLQGQPLSVSPDSGVIARLGVDQKGVERLCHTSAARFQEIAGRYNAA